MGSEIATGLSTAPVVPLPTRRTVRSRHTPRALSTMMALMPSSATDSERMPARSAADAQELRARNGYEVVILIKHQSNVIVLYVALNTRQQMG